jgi:LysR family nitrogen assimilation transcriptional regulator
MGVPLLSRHSRGVEPTQAGTVLYQHARRILDQVDQVKAEVVRAHLTARRPVSLGLPTSLTLLIGTDLQIAAAERTQRIALSIVEGPSFFLAVARRAHLDHGEAEALLSDTRLLVDQGIDMIVNRAAPHVERH